jgi:hypothetical protein
VTQAALRQQQGMVYAIVRTGVDKYLDSLKKGKIN